MTRPNRVRLSVDIGGTFTDLEFRNETTGASGSFKAATTPDDPSIGLVNAMQGAAARYGFTLDEVEIFIHGTTIATNAVLTRDLPDCALITTCGFEDVLEIGRHARRDIYGLKPEDRVVLVPRRRRFGVVERIGADGSIVTALDERDLERVIGAVRSSGATTVAICLINAHVNAAHERAIREHVAAALPDVRVSCSHEVSPEIREYERTATTVLNAMLIPVVQRYVDGLLTRSRAAGLKAPVYLVQSNGGAATPEQAGQTPVNLLLSGPSGGVLAAEKVASVAGRPNIVAVDMGGTSYDIAIIQNGRRSIIAQGDVDTLPVRVPMVEMRTIGAGGGSIIWLDEGGRLQVGPKSAGAKPGPVCYRRGGMEPTVTDINLILGRLDPARFLGGELELDLDGARHALKTRIADPLGLTLDAAAAGVLAIVEARLAGAIKLSLFERGLDPRDFALMSFGGAGGLHALEVAEELGMAEVIFPREPSTFSAHGILSTDIVHELARTRVMPLTPAGMPEIESLATELRAAGNALLDRDRLPAERRSLRLAADLRYRGQAFELMVPLDDGPLDATALDRLAERFHALHLQRFSFDDRDEGIELVSLRLSAVGLISVAAAAGARADTRPMRATSDETRHIHLNGRWQDAAVFVQSALAPGAQLAGPAVIEQPYTTMIVPAGWRVIVLPSGDLLASRETA